MIRTRRWILIVSGPRCMAVLFPVFFLIGEAMRRSRPVRWGYAAPGSAALLLESVKFSLGYWVS